MEILILILVLVVVIVTIFTKLADVQKDVDRQNQLVTDIYKRMAAYEAWVENCDRRHREHLAERKQQKPRGRRAKAHKTIHGDMTIKDIAKKYKVTHKYVYKLISEFSGNIESVISYFDKRK